MDEVKKCNSCRKVKAVAEFGRSSSGRRYRCCNRCLEYFRAYKREVKMRGGPSYYHWHATSLEELSRAVCLVCELPAEVCRGQLNAGCIAQYAPEAQKGEWDGRDRTFRIPEMEDSRLEAEPLAALPPGSFETAGVARARGSDRAGEVWMRLR